MMIIIMIMIIMMIIMIIIIILYIFLFSSSSSQVTCFQEWCVRSVTLFLILKETTVIIRRVVGV